MRILHILNQLRPSGAEQMLRIATPYWLSHGCDLHILSLEKQPGDFIEELEKVGWKIHIVDATKGIRSLWLDAGKVIDEVRPDILHVHPEAYGALLPLLGWTRRITMVRTVHAMFKFKGALRWRKYAERWLSRQIGLQFIAIGDSVYSNELDRFGNRCELLWNWFDSEHFHLPTETMKQNARASLGLADSKKVILSVGNSAPVKNYGALIEAVSILKDPSVLYCQVGHADPKGEEQALVQKLRITEQVRFCGPSNQILSYLWAADVFAMPSLREGFGLSAVEALASGCSCIFSERPGLRDFKDIASTIAWVEPSSSSIAAGIQRQLDTPPAQSLRAETSKRAREKFSSVAGAERYLTLWKQLLTSK